jgi:alpha-aminoadipate carrier protein LysW
VVKKVGAVLSLAIMMISRTIRKMHRVDWAQCGPGLNREDLTVGPGELNIIRVSPGTEAFMVYCPECESDLDIEEDEVDEGEVVSCPECGTDFEIVTVNPLELKPVEELEDDEEEEEEEEDGDA